MFRAHYFIGNQLLATSEEFDCPHTPHSLAYFCSTCGEVWGRIAVTGGHRAGHWRVESVPCSMHVPDCVANWSAFPGSFLRWGPLSKQAISTMDWARAIEHLPMPVLKREFERHLDWFEKREATT